MKSALSILVFLSWLFAVSACRVQNSPPELVEVSPVNGFVGSQVTLSGYQFGAEPVVTFGAAGTAAKAQIISASEQEIRAVVPVMAPGNTTIRIQTAEGISDPLPFRVDQPAPTLASPSPDYGLPGATVVLTGTYLNQLQEVRFNDTPAVVQDSSVQALTVLVPIVPRGPATIVVTTIGGEIQQSFTVAGMPAISSLSQRILRPGAELIIRGTNLTDGIVRINGTPTDRSQTVVRDTEIRTVVPPSATSGRVTVTVFEKLVATSADSVLIYLPPSVAGLSAREAVAGDKLMLNGNNLRDVTAVQINNTAASFRVVSNAQIEATVPAFASAANLSVSVASPVGNATSPETFFYYPAPSNLTVNPDRQLRNRPIAITGQNLYRITDVRVNGQSVPITDRVEGSQLLVSVPVNAVSGPVSVISRAGTASTARPLVVLTPAVITDIIPLKARPGERVVIRGELMLNAQIFFTGAASPAPDGGKNEDTERWVLVPPDAQTGPIRIFNASGVDTYTAAFSVIRLAVLTDFTPKTAKVGAELTITGQNLNSVTQVRFNGGTLAASFRLSGNSLIVTVPAGATTGQICLLNEAGNACSSASFTIAN